MQPEEKVNRRNLLISGKLWGRRAEVMSSIEVLDAEGTWSDIKPICPKDRLRWFKQSISRYLHN